MTSIDLHSRTALVIGAFSGLGLRFARVLTAHGAKLALLGRRIELGRAIAAEIGAAVAPAMRQSGRFATCLTIRYT
jgi:NAD(P)-dependent dehydrogenase (short-subunit alcohol dehydrogenase family)